MILLSAGCANPVTWPVGIEIDLELQFEGLDGCFVLLAPERNRYHRYRPERCAEPLSPCSTFKIPNALIGLESGVITGPDHVMPWDGVPRWRPALNRDHDLDSAMEHSVVWYFQNIATEVGADAMAKWLNLIEYGNRDISGGLTTFWLGSSLKISANEQVEFLRKLYDNELPFSTRNESIVKSAIELERGDDIILRGKTGTDSANGHVMLGWFVGYIVSDRGAHIFATNIRDVSGAEAKEITMRILHDLHLY
jgi:beta-lactamase class D